MRKDYFQYFDPEYLAKFNSLIIASKFLLDGYMLGIHKSPLHGFSSEFSQHKSYVVGDPIKYLDWKVYSRTDRLYIKQFEDETNVSSNIFLDNSKSMYFKSTESKLSKIEYARMIAGALIHLFISKKDSVSLGTFGDGLKQFIPSGNTDNHLKLIFELLASNKSYAEESTIDGYKNIFSSLTKSGFTIIFSDFLDNFDDIFQNILNIKSKRQDILLFMIADESERKLRHESNVKYVDSESGSAIDINTTFITKEYERVYQEHLRNIKKCCSNYNISLVYTTTNTPFYIPLKEILEKRK